MIDCLNNIWERWQRHPDLIPWNVIAGCVLQYEIMVQSKPGTSEAQNQLGNMYL